MTKYASTLGMTYLQLLLFLTGLCTYLSTSGRLGVQAAPSGTDRKEISDMTENSFSRTEVGHRLQKRSASTMTTNGVQTVVWHDGRSNMNSVWPCHVYNGLWGRCNENNCVHKIYIVEAEGHNPEGCNNGWTYCAIQADGWYNGWSSRNTLINGLHTYL